MKDRLLSMMILFSVVSAQASPKFPVTALKQFAVSEKLFVEREKSMRRDRLFHAWSQYEKDQASSISVDAFNGVTEFGQVRLGCRYHKPALNKREMPPEFVAYCEDAFAKLYQALANEEPAKELVERIATKKLDAPASFISQDASKIRVRVQRSLWGYDHEEIWPELQFDFFPAKASGGAR